MNQKHKLLHLADTFVVDHLVSKFSWFQRVQLDVADFVKMDDRCQLNFLVEISICVNKVDELKVNVLVKLAFYKEKHIT